MLIKTPEEIKKLQEGGKIIGGILSKLGKMAQVGVTTHAIDVAAEEMIIAAGGRPAFKGYMTRPDDPPFPCTICASRNHELVHGIAKKTDVLQPGDIFSIDIGMEYPVGKSQISNSKSQINHKSQITNLKSQITRGWFTDTAITVAVGEIDPRTRELMRVTRQALEVGIRAVKPGKSVAEIGRAIETYVKSQGKYGIVRDLVGHGVGHEVHEEPRVPNYYDKSLEKFILKPGMVIAIEPMISLGGHDVATGPDGWTIEMSDGSMCAHSEHTVVVTRFGRTVITRRPGERFEKI
ncbi:MAG: M24 family metallopeptidase [Candidatus Magasanikbacteria bacterium]|jgi:methionyl aminopeptidase